MASESVTTAYYKSRASRVAPPLTADCHRFGPGPGPPWEQTTRPYRLTADNLDDPVDQEEGVRAG
ncbi:MAG: hypothetical protein AB7V27_18285 [Candidatus Binatia bacterium]